MHFIRSADRLNNQFVVNPLVTNKAKETIRDNLKGDLYIV